MELYNFFSITTTDKEQIKALRIIKGELQEREHQPCTVHLVRHLIEEVGMDSYKTKTAYTLIGQILSDDTNIGSTELLGVFGEIPFSMFDAYFHPINWIYNSSK
jgi:hypothetical protein